MRKTRMKKLLELGKNNFNLILNFKISLELCLRTLDLHLLL